VSRNIVETYSGIGSGTWWLEKSQEFLPDNEMFELASACALKIEQKGTVLVCQAYVSKNSPIDLLTGFPAGTLHKEGSFWDESGESNGFVLKAKNTRHVQGDEIHIETVYDLPSGYDGPLYAKRLVVLDLKSLKIWKVEMTFQNGRKDFGIFAYSGEDSVKIDWTLNSGFLNQMNIKFS